MHLVSEGREGVSRLLGNATFEVQTTRVIAVRLIGVGETVGGKARRFDRFLGIHTEESDIQKSLQHGLRLYIPAGGAEGHQGPPVAQRQRRVWRQARTLSRSNARSMTGVSPRL